MTPALHSPELAVRKARLTGFTVGPLPAITADALVRVDAIDAGATVFTGVALTVINI